MARPFFDSEVLKFQQSWRLSTLFGGPMHRSIGLMLAGVFLAFTSKTPGTRAEVNTTTAGTGSG